MLNAVNELAVALCKYMSVCEAVGPKMSTGVPLYQKSLGFVCAISFS